jgi:ABC-type ATPase with predicted acetyltransferase domain
MKKKVIYETFLIGNTNGEYVQQQMTDTISKWQIDGFEVEVHFAANNSQMVVLLLKYQMV